MSTQIRQLPITFIKSKEVTAEFVEMTDPDVIVLALGGNAPAADTQNRPWILTGGDIYKIIQGRMSSKGNALQSALWHLGSTLIRYLYWPFFIRWLLSFNFPFGKKIAVLGGGYAGCSLAYFLAQKGKKVVIIEESSKLLSDMGITTRWVLKMKLRESGVRMVTEAKVKRMAENGVEINHAGAKEFLESDKVVLAKQLQPNMQLATELKDSGKEIYFIGDSNNPAKIKEAVSSGFAAGMDI
jgi:2,4-dienoyl-CoA reductase (NADPH2)